MATSLFIDVDSAAPLELKILRTKSITREAVPSDDGSEHGYIRWVFDVECWYHNLATSTSLSGFPQDNNPPARTDIGTLHSRLMAKRRRFVYYHVGSETAPQPMELLRCPANGYNVDSKNGPNPLRCDIVAITNKTFKVNYVLECHTGPCADNNAPAIVWHRWSESHDIDRQARTVRSVQGAVQFRSDALSRAGSRPDNFRDELFHPIPNRCVRENIKTQASSDGLQLVYSFQDREEFLLVGSQSAVRKAEVFVTSMGQLGKATKGIGGCSVLVRLWGANLDKYDGMDSMQYLTILAMGVAAAKLKQNNLVLTDSISVTQVFHERFVELQATAMTAPDAVAQEDIFSFVTRPLYNNGQLPAFIIGDPNKFPGFRAGDSRGTYVGIVAAAALRGECVAHERPQNIGE